MPMSPAAQLAALKLILANQAWAGVGDGPGLQPSGADGTLYVALHTAAPAASSQASNEATFGSYARQPISRALASFAFSGANPTLAAIAAALTFPTATGGVTETETYWSLGVAASGAGQILIAAPLTTPLPIAAGYTVSFVIGQLVFTAE